MAIFQKLKVIVYAISGISKFKLKNLPGQCQIKMKEIGPMSSSNGNGNTKLKNYSITVCIETVYQ